MQGTRSDADVLDGVVPKLCDRPANIPALVGVKQDGEGADEESPRSWRQRTKGYDKQKVCGQTNNFIHLAFSRRSCVFSRNESNGHGVLHHRIDGAIHIWGSFQTCTHIYIYIYLFCGDIEFHYPKPTFLGLGFSKKKS